MVKSLLFVICFFCLSNLFAQITGFVKDNSTKKLISYVNVWVENENIGTTSTINGEFNLPAIEKSKTLVFSAIGYETKKVEISNLKNIIYLTPIDYQLSEVVIVPKKKLKTLKIGSFKKSGISFSFGVRNTPWIIARFFQYEPEYERTPFLKTIKLLTNSDLKNTKFNIRLYSKGENGEPKDYIYKENIIATAEKGNKITEVDLSKLNIQFPKNGFFVAVEWLIIDENKFEFENTEKNTKKKIKTFRYEPSIGAVPMETNENGWLYIKGKWRTIFKNQYDKGPDKYKDKYSVIAVELTLTE